MLSARAFTIVLLAFCAAGSTGCSSLGLSLYPTGHSLTEQAETVLAQSPRRPDIARELEMDVQPVHYLQPGEVLLIEPADLDADVRIPADQTVLADGTVDLGKYGRLIVAGITPEAAESLIEKTLIDAGEEATPINVRLLEPVHRYYVLGEVNSPGSYPLDGYESVLDGILAAGGLTSAAAPCKILLARPTQANSCRITLPVCYREITQMGDTTTNYQLRPGDRIFVATRSCCEDLMFWQATQTCDRCCGCQTACPDPNMVAPANPMSRVGRTGVVGPSFFAAPSSEMPTPATGPGRAANLTEQDAAPENLLPLSASPQATGGFDAKANRMPLPIDGELDFESSESAERFEPLWITPSK